MLDRNALRAKSDQVGQQTNHAEARPLFVRALDGLRLAHRQTQIARFPEGHPDCLVEGQTIVTLSGGTKVVFEMLRPLSPELRRFEEWQGTRDDGRQVRGFDLLVDWPSLEQQKALLARANESGLREICDALEAGIAASQQRAKGELDALQAKCDARSGQGHRTASAMMLKPMEDFIYPELASIYGQIQPKWLGPAASIVWEALADDKPTLERAGQGRGSYHNIMVSW